MNEFKIKGHTYRANKICAMDQLHLVRRLAPAVVGVVGLAGVKDIKALGPAMLLSKIGPFLDALGRMSDDDVEFVTDMCLSVIERQVGADRGWQKVGGSRALQYEDIDLAVMLRLAFEAGKENLAGFFDALQSMFQGEE